MLKHTFLTILHLYYIGFFLNPKGLDSENTVLDYSSVSPPTPMPSIWPSSHMDDSPSWRPLYKQGIG